MVLGRTTVLDLFLALALYEKNVYELQDLEMNWNTIRQRVPPLENVIYPLAAEISLLSAELIYQKVFEIVVIQSRRNTSSNVVLANDFYERAYMVPFIASAVRGVMTIYIEGK